MFDATTYLQGEWYDGPVVRDMQRQRQQLQDALAVSRESGDAQINAILTRLAQLHELARLDDMEAAFNAATPF